LGDHVEYSRRPLAYARGSDTITLREAVMRARGLGLAGALTILVPLGAWCQAIVEYSLGVGRAAMTAPAMKKAGEASAATFKKLGETLGKGSEAQAQVYAGAPETPVPYHFDRPLGPFADPATIAVGLDRQELLRKFGEPRMKATGGADGAETCWYPSGTGDSFVVTVKEGKVSAVALEPKKQQASAGVVILQ
jgi:hypothetical protein